MPDDEYCFGCGALIIFEFTVDAKGVYCDLHCRAKFTAELND